jgi:hypothetical protein
MILSLSVYVYLFIYFVIEGLKVFLVLFVII